jgi:hypothetical protein
MAARVAGAGRGGVRVDSEANADRLVSHAVPVCQARGIVSWVEWSPPPRRGVGAPKTRRVHARRSLPRLLARSGWRCQWCGCELTTPAEVCRLGGTLVSDPARNEHCLRWLDAGGRLRRTARATVDHVMPLRDGGDNGQDNLVPACVPCNTGRTAQPRKKAR